MLSSEPLGGASTVRSSRLVVEGLDAADAVVVALVLPELHARSGSGQGSGSGSGSG